MSGAIRLIAVDVDGTLLDPDGAVRPRVERSIKQAITAGCRVILATGRRLQSASPIARRLGISTLILVDGAVIHDLDDGTIYEQCLSLPLQRQAVELVQSVGVPPILFESPSASARIVAGPPALDNDETANYLRQRPEVFRVPPDHLSGHAHIVSVVGMGPRQPIEQLAAMAARVNDFGTVFWSPSNSGYRTYVVGLNAPNVSKGRALQWLASRWGIALSETMAIGDYENDVSLIATAGIGVAMGNAVPSLKEVAGAVVADNANDGVAEALERWVLRTEGVGD